MSELDNNNINKMFDTNENENENDMASVDCLLYNLKVSADQKYYNLQELDIDKVILRFPLHFDIYVSNMRYGYLTTYFDSSCDCNRINKWVRAENDSIYFNANDIFIHREEKKLIILNSSYLYIIKNELQDNGFMRLIDMYKDDMYELVNDTELTLSN